VSSFNRVILLGNLTRDVEVKYLQSGTAVAEIGLAVNEKRKDQSGNWIEDVTFVDVTLWGRTAEVAAEYLSKGSQALIEGRLKLEQWEQDGQKRSKLKVIGEKMQMLGSRGSGEQQDQPRQQTQPRSAVAGNRQRNTAPVEEESPF
jgi:single-strand DNA-binding protein